MYVKPIPLKGDIIYPISRNGGSGPRWSQTTDELFYIDPDDNLMAVPIKTKEYFDKGNPEKLFPTNITHDRIPHRENYDYDSINDRFLIGINENDSDIPPIRIIVNWTQAMEE
ncbi:MAG: hypothetical protein P8Z37_01245 [Acidobacteriota bacterium]